MSRSRPLPWMILILLLAAVAIRLGVWQLERLGDRRATNLVELAARDLPPLDLTLPGADDSLLAGRRITARGHFEPAGEIYLRNRAHNQAPGVHVTTPFAIDATGDQLWVVRGFAFAPDGITPRFVTSPQSGTVTISGVASSFPMTEDAGQPIPVEGKTSYRRLDAIVARQLEPRSLDGFVYLAGDTGGPGQLPAVLPPALDEGPHFSYAIQWFGIAAAMLTFGWLVILRPRGGRGSAPPPAAP